MALIALGMSLVVGIGLLARNTFGVQMNSRLVAMLTGIGTLCPITVGMCIYYLFSTSAQNAGFIKWAERHRWGRAPLVVDWTLFDATDPNYDVTTIKYLLAKRADRKFR